MKKYLGWIALAAGISFLSLAYTNKISTPNAKKPTVQATALIPIKPSATNAAFRSMQTQASPAPVAASSFIPPSTHASWPKALLGTSLDGDILQDPNGNLIPSQDLRLLWDHLLLAQGEPGLQTSDQIRAFIENILEQKLSEPAQTQAKRLLGQYLAYRRAAALWLQRRTQKHDAKPSLSLDIQALKAKLAGLHQLRQAHLGEAAPAFFAEQEAAAYASMLDVEQKQERTAPQNPNSNPRPAWMQLARQESLQHLELAKLTQALQQHHASSQEVLAQRTHIFGAAAAKRLAALDTKRADWNARLTHYRNMQAQLPASSDAAAQTRLLQSLFTQEEQLRIPK